MLAAVSYTHLGVLVWGNLNDGLAAWTYSLTYNGSYMLPDVYKRQVLQQSLPAAIRPQQQLFSLCSTALWFW